MKLQIVGNCPDCGAPVYGDKSHEGKKAPKVTYQNLVCHTALPPPNTRIRGAGAANQARLAAWNRGTGGHDCYRGEAIGA